MTRRQKAIAFFVALLRMYEHEHAPGFDSTLVPAAGSAASTQNAAGLPAADERRSEAG